MVRFISYVSVLSMMGWLGAQTPRVARLTYMSGNVSYRPATQDGWGPATLGYPLGAGDHLWSDADADSGFEVQVGKSFLNMPGGTAFSILSVGPGVMEFSVSQGCLNITARAEQGDSFEIDTPQVAISLIDAGSYRVDVDPGLDTTTVSVFSGSAEVNGSGKTFDVGILQRVRFKGTKELLAQSATIVIDGFDLWCWSRHLPSDATWGERLYYLTINAVQWLHSIVSPKVLISLCALLICTCVLFITWTTLYFFRPRTLLSVHSVLNRFSDIELLGKRIRVPLEDVLLIRIYAFGPRVLDAWVREQLPHAIEDFRRRESVYERAVWVPTPVLLNDRALPELCVSDLHQAFKRVRSTVLVWGEGGAGKTSIALQIARWAAHENPDEQLIAQYAMVPVLIESDLYGQTLSDAIHGQLRAAIGVDGPLPNDLLHHLLVRKRILVIVDGYSEMSQESRNAVLCSDPKFDVNAIVVTSRRREELNGVARTLIQTMRIRSNRLFPFVSSYLLLRDKSELFVDEEFAACTKTLARVIGSRDITVLMAKPFTEQMIDKKIHLAGRDADFELQDADLPHNTPDLMLAYINTLNRQVPKCGCKRPADTALSFC